MITYIYKTKLCTWVIRNHQYPNLAPLELCWYLPEGEWERSGYYTHANQAADDVFCQATSFSDWDMLNPESIPDKIRDIGNWTQVKSYP